MEFHLPTSFLATRSVGGRGKVRPENVPSCRQIDFNKATSSSFKMVFNLLETKKSYVLAIIIAPQKWKNKNTLKKRRINDEEEV